MIDILATASLLVSNVLLSAYPVLIKLFVGQVSVAAQLLIRTAVYIGLTVPFLVGGGLGGPMLAALVSAKYLAISAVNVLHIYTSYMGFTLLNAGTSLTTFYTYPILQVLLSWAFLHTRLTSSILQHLGGCLLGIATLNYNSYRTGAPSASITQGFGYIGLAALTEAIIGVFYKHDNLSNPFLSLFTLYAPMGLWVLVGAALLYYYNNYDNANKNKHNVLVPANNNNNKNNIWTKVVLFNVLIGAVGYLLRLYALTHTSIEWFSGLLFTSSVSAFVLGWLFLKERIHTEHWVGTMIIFYNLYKMSLETS
jgi:uncharacterized membrane protein